MSKHINAASRLISILEKASSRADNMQALEAWAELLGVKERHPHRRVVAIGELLCAMHKEPEYAMTGLATSDFSKSLYESAFSHIEHALSPMLFQHKWDQVKQHLTPDVLTALAFCTEILPDEEIQLSIDELSSIRAKVEELRATLTDTRMPPRLRTLIQHHIQLIEHALAVYPIIGAKALREAAHIALGEMIEAKDEIAPEKDSIAVLALGAVWKSVNRATDIALRTEKLVQLGQRAWDSISGIF